MRAVAAACMSFHLLQPVAQAAPRDAHAAVESDEDTCLADLVLCKGEEGEPGIAADTPANSQFGLVTSNLKFANIMDRAKILEAQDPQTPGSADAEGHVLEISRWEGYMSIIVYVYMIIMSFIILKRSGLAPSCPHISLDVDAFFVTQSHAEPLTPEKEARETSPERRWRELHEAIYQQEVMHLHHLEGLRLGTVGRSMADSCIFVSFCLFYIL